MFDRRFMLSVRSFLSDWANAGFVSHRIAYFLGSQLDRLDF
jgi:hypothetical protein